VRLRARGSLRARPTSRRGLWRSCSRFLSGPSVRTGRFASRHRVLRAPARSIEAAVVELRRGSRSSMEVTVARVDGTRRHRSGSHRLAVSRRGRSVKARAARTVVGAARSGDKCLAQSSRWLEESEHGALVWSSTGCKAVVGEVGMAATPVGLRRRIESAGRCPAPYQRGSGDRPRADYTRLSRRSSTASAAYSVTATESSVRSTAGRGRERNIIHRLSASRSPRARAVSGSRCAAYVVVG